MLRHFYGPKPEKGPNTVIGLLTVPLHEHSVIRLFHLSMESFEFIKKHGSVIPEMLGVAKGDKSLDKLVFSQQDFQNQYGNLIKPGAKWIIGPEGQEELSLVDFYARESARHMLLRIGQDRDTADIPMIAKHIDSVLRGKVNLTFSDAATHRKYYEALVRLHTAVGDFTTDVIHDATLATAEAYYSEMSQLHVGNFIRDIKHLIIPSGYAFGTAALVSAMFPPLAPIAMPVGVGVSVLKERSLHKNRKVKIISPDGSHFEERQYRDLSVDPIGLAECIDEVIKYTGLPGQGSLILEPNNHNSKLSRKRAIEMGTALITQVPNYFDLVRRLQAYNIFLYTAKEEEKARKKKKGRR